jgi:sensor histidine kinase YesM
MLLNRQKRIQYLGFDDLRFMIVGILILSFVTDFLFSNSFLRYPFRWAVLIWSISLFFATMDWIILRLVLIRLRKRFPNMKDDVKRITLFFLSIVVTVLTVDYIGGTTIEALLGENFNYSSNYKVQIPVILISTMTMAIYEAVFYYLRLKKSIVREEESKRAAVQAQLDALRNQSQPHFFFNSLNTLRDIIDHNTKAEAKTFVNKLAEVYRFVLQTGKQNLIPLEDEIEFAKAYVHIQQERFGDNLKLDWGEGKQKGQLVVPTSIQLLIENAIKHNVVSKSKPLVVRVLVEENTLVVENKIQPKSTQISSTKLGLKNLWQRYNLLGDRGVLITDQEGVFRVEVPLLSSTKETP